MANCWQPSEVLRQETVEEQRQRATLPTRQRIEQLQQHLWTCPDDAKALYALSQTCWQMGEVASFVIWVRAFCGVERRAWKNSCRVLVEGLGRTSDALSMLHEMHRKEPDSAWVCCYLAKLSPKQDAEYWYEKAFAAEPGCCAAQIAMADIHRKAQRFEQAARLYKAAHDQSPASKPLYRLGEALVQDGKTQQGRQYLLDVLQGDDTTYHVHAAVTLSLSFVLDQEYEEALRYCTRAEELEKLPGIRAIAGHASFGPLQLTQLLKGITLLRIGEIETAIRTLFAATTGTTLSSSFAGGSVACEAADVSGRGQDWQLQTIWQTLSHAEILRGDLAAAQRHMESAAQIAGPACDPDVLVGKAYLHQAREEWEEAERLLRQCLRLDNSSGLALLRMGYVLLCRDQVDRSIQFFQKCRERRHGLKFGKAQRGAAHIYLCIAHHWRRFGASTLTTDSTCIDSVAEENFHKGYELQPELQASLARIRSACVGRPGTAYDLASRLLGGKPSRLVTLDLTPEQAAVLLLYAERAGVGPVVGGQAALDKAVASASSGRQFVAVSQDANTGVGSNAAPNSALCGAPLLGTVSTTTSTSAGPSRNSSDPNLRRGAPLCGSTRSCSTIPDATVCELRGGLPPDKCVDFADIDFGECISRGEMTLVYKATLCSSRQEVVVKMLHSTERAVDGSAAEDLRAEINIISKLSHPRLVVFVGACLQPSRVALVTKFALGGNLHQALHVQRRQFARGERFNLAEELLEGVQYLHSRTPPIAHLDLKSLNLLLDAEGRHLQICDFGLARELCGTSSSDACNGPRIGASEGACSSFSKPPTRGGSPRYMAPECYDAVLGPVSEKADVWAAGCILIEVFGDCLPYAECSNVQQILKNMLVHRCGPLVPSTIEAPVRAVVSNALAFEAAQRLAIGQVLAQLQRAAGGNKPRLAWCTLSEA